MESGHERRCLDLFLSAGYLRAHEICRGHRIDFVLSGTSRIGVEVTRVFDDETEGGSADQQEAAHWARAMELAQASHRRRAPAHGWVVVRVCPSPGLRLGWGAVDGVAAWLAGVVATLDFSARATHHLGSEDLYDAGCPDEILAVDATFLGSGQPEWATSGFGWASAVSGQAIQRALRRKEPKVARYDNGLSQLWCLLVFDGSVAASLRLLQPDVEEFSYASSFDRAFVLDCTGRCAEISLHMPSAGSIQAVAADERRGS